MPASTEDPSGADFRARYRAAVERLLVQRLDWVRDARVLHLSASVPPWSDTGITVERGERLTVLAAGRVTWSRKEALFGWPRYHLWGQIGSGPVFRLGSDTYTLAAEDGGPLRLCVLHGTWASPQGILATSVDAYRSLGGGIDVLVVRWGDVSPDLGLALLGVAAQDDSLIAEERARLGARHEAPPGFEPLWFVGRSDIFYRSDVDAVPAIALRADANAGVVRKPVEFLLWPGTFLEWTWRMNGLPSRVREDAFATHDYASIALEFQDGRDLSWYWSAALPVGHHYGCPLPRWAGRETHVVVRSGFEGVGAWTDERRDVHADAVRAFGRAPSRIVAVWLIGVSLFQRGYASADFRRIALVRGARVHTIFPS